jgi:tetratricopeptide (TPR) repeat protein
MYEPLAGRLADPLVQPACVSEAPDELPPADSFMDLLAEIERRRHAGAPDDVLARYQAWITRNSAASPALYAVWFNLGVELSGAGDKAGAMEAYQNALALRPGFYPAAINLGTLLEAAGQTDAALTTWQQALQPADTRAGLLQHRARLAEKLRIQQETAAVVLHIGGGAPLPPGLLRPGWRVVRAETDADVQGAADGLADAVYASGLQYRSAQEVPSALREMLRVLRPAGFAMLQLPDLQQVARPIAEGRLDEPLYGSVTPLDILYGHGSGPVPRTGFTSGTLAAAVIGAGFAAAMVQRDPPACGLTAIAFRTRPEAATMAALAAQLLPASDLPAVLFTPAG